MLTREVTATAILQKTEDGRLLVTDERDVVIGKPVILLMPDGKIIRTSSVREWNHYGCFYIRTAHTQYNILCERVQ